MGHLLSHLHDDRPRSKDRFDVPAVRGLTRARYDDSDGDEEDEEEDEGPMIRPLRDPTLPAFQSKHSNTPSSKLTWVARTQMCADYHHVAQEEAKSTISQLRDLINKLRRRLWRGETDENDESGTPSTRGRPLTEARRLLFRR